MLNPFIPLLSQVLRLVHTMFPALDARYRNEWGVFQPLGQLISHTTRYPTVDDL